MLNEVQEFRDYTRTPDDTGKNILGRFTVESIRDFLGFERIFTVLARYYLFRSGDPYENVDCARRALCAWASIPDDGKDINGWEGKFTTCFAELHEEFPNLVDAEGNGWYIRHIHAISDLARQEPKKAKANVKKYLVDKLPEFEAKWRDKVRQFQIPIYYNKFWLEVQHPAGLSSVSCLSYNKRSNWLAIPFLGFHVRQKDCQPSSCCSVRFEQVEP